MTSVLYLNAYFEERYTSVRLGMSKHHSLWMGITLESDVTRICEYEGVEGGERVF